jgi:hypothetical protein
MKKHILLYIISSLFLCCLLCVLSCTKTEEKRELPVSVSPICILLVDAKTNNPIKTTDIERIDFAGRDWIKVVDFLKQKPVKAANEMITVGLKLNDNDPEPSLVDPYFYTIIVKIKDCLPVVIPIRVDEKTSETKNKVVRVINLKNLPDGITEGVIDCRHDKGTSVGVGAAAVYIPSLLTFKDIKGDLIKNISSGDKINGKILNLDMKNPVVSHLFPSSLTTTLGKDSLGTFSVSACTYLDIRIPSASVSKFGNIDIIYDMGSPPKISGDWGLWSFNDQGNWLQKNKMPIANNSTTKIQVDSLSWWMVGKFTPADKKCTTELCFENFAEGMNLWCEVQDAETGQLVTDGFSVSIRADGKVKQTLRNLPTNTKLKALLYNNPFDVINTPPINSPLQFLTCNTLTINGNGYGKDTTQFTPFTMDVKLQCNKGVVNILIEPDMPIYMRATGDVRWTYMGYMKTGKLFSRAMKLTIGKQYDMMTPAFPELLWNGETLKSYTITIDKNNCG